MGPVVVDAGVVIAWLDAADALHAQALAALEAHEGEQIALPASAYAETLVRPLAHGADPLRVRRILDDVGIAVEPIGSSAAEAAARLRGMNAGLRLPDALVLGYADAVDARTVLTTDRRWLRVGARVELVG